MATRSTSSPTGARARSRTSGRGRVRPAPCRQITDFQDYDVTTPSLGPTDIVFVAGDRLHLLNLANDAVSEVSVQVVTDRSTLKPRSVKVADRITSVSVSPTGKRAAFEARGEIFSVPAEHGPVMSLSRSSGVAERYPRWSPDGKTLAYWSDRSGEYELTLRPADGTGAERTLTSLGAGYRYAPHWSPDSSRLAFVDQAMKIRIVDVAQGRVVDVDQSPAWMAHGQLQGLSLKWSPDSRWLTWARRPADSGNARRVRLRRHDAARAARSRRRTSTTWSRPSTPTASTSTSSRTGPSIRSTATSTTAGRTPTPRASSRPRSARDTASPLSPRNDVEGAPDKKDEGKKEDGKKDEGAKDEGKKEDSKKADEKRTRRRPHQSRWPSTSRASSPESSCCRPRPATTTAWRPWPARFSIAVSREPDRARRRARWCTTTSPSARRRPSPAASTASR